MFKELFKQMGPVFTTFFTITAALGIVFSGFVIYFLILLASYLHHHM